MFLPQWIIIQICYLILNETLLFRDDDWGREVVYPLGCLSEHNLKAILIYLCDLLDLKTT